MVRLTPEEKMAAIETITNDGRPIMAIVKAKKINNAPAYSSGSIRKRSRDSAKKRVSRYKDMASGLAAD